MGWWRNYVDAVRLLRSPSFPPVIIQHTVWLYLRLTLSYRDMEDLLAERALDMSYETIRRWVLKFGRSMPTICGAAGLARATNGTWTRWW